MDILVGLSFAMSIIALVFAFGAYRFSRKAFTIIENRNTRTIVVNTDDGKITVIKEYKNDPISTN